MKHSAKNCSGVMTREINPIENAYIIGKYFFYSNLFFAGSQFFYEDNLIGKSRRKKVCSHPYGN